MNRFKKNLKLINAWFTKKRSMALLNRMAGIALLMMILLLLLLLTGIANKNETAARMRGVTVVHEQEPPTASTPADHDDSPTERTDTHLASDTSATTHPVPSDSIPLPVKPIQPNRIHLLAVGDLILHQSVIDGGLQRDGHYLYDHVFEAVAPFIQEADYAMAGYEGTLNGPPYSGYPLFGAPDEIAGAIRNAGFDLVATANNHALDRRLEGLIRTPKILAEHGLFVAGTRSSTSDPLYHIVSIEGISIGFTSWTWETIGTDTTRHINGIPLPKEGEELIDSFNPFRPDRYAQDLQRMADRIAQMRQDGAEVIVFIPHWGAEYETTSNRQQRQMAQFLCNQGVDIIFGLHPHVLQEIDVLTSEDGMRQTPVFYSLSGFLSNMEFGTHGTKGYAEDAIIASVWLERDQEGVVRPVRAAYTGVYVYKDRTGPKLMHRTLPVRDAMLHPENYRAKEAQKLLKASALRIEKVMSQNRTGEYFPPITEWISPAYASRKPFLEN